ncbi:MAG: Rieske 2Fe-2S domain-containing protein [Chromatiales bacterium]|nr:MAG: Rieske 2Fe-2S domain-containing protein [Chromatiales bacterium]
MTQRNNQQIRDLVREDRVHRDLYVNPDVFDLEMDRIWSRAWIFVGHDSQVPNAGDFYATEIGREPVIMVRQTNGDVRVLHNRCAHKGAKLTGRPQGNCKGFRCPYHGWTYKLDGRLAGVPARKGYDNTPFDMKDPRFSLAPVAQADSYRGFVFATLDPNAPPLPEFLDDAAATLDNIADRAPEGEVEVAGPPLRYLHNCNWKMFVENLNDAMHPMVAHASVGNAARRYVAEQPEGTEYPPEAEIIFPFGSSYEFFDKMQVTALPHGHAYMGGELSIHSDYSAVPGYWDAMVKSYGEERTKKILSQNRHNTIFYPSFTAKDAIQAVRVCRPIAVDKTMIESWHFRLKGAPEQMLKRTILYSRLINSNASMVGPDDWDCYTRIQEGLVSDAKVWVDTSRGLGREEAVGDGRRKSFGTSDLSYRNQIQAWLEYMTDEVAA